MIVKLINSANAPLGLSSAFSNGVTSGANLITLSGTAPLDARTLTLNGEALAVSWTSRTAWTAKVPLPSGSNTFVLNGLDGFGQPLTNPPVPIAISITQPTDSPVGQVQITEILPTPSLIGGASWIELYNASLTTAFDLSGWRIEGLNYTIPAGTTLAAKGRLVVPSDRFAFTGIPQNLIGNEIPSGIHW